VRVSCFLDDKQYNRFSRRAPQQDYPQVEPSAFQFMRNQFKIWAGYAFENVCLNHIQQIAKALGFSGIIYSFSSWRYKPKAQNDKGVQIDILIERSDNCINLCEIKFFDGKFTVTKEYSEKLLYKKQKFIEVTKTRKTVFTTLITIYGSKENSWYLEAVNNQLSVDDLFIPL
jgi:hypothetical protein